jgi:hypothetical protein
LSVIGCGNEQPLALQTNSAISLPEHLNLANHPAIRKNPMNHPKERFPALTGNFQD